MFDRFRSNGSAEESTNNNSNGDSPDSTPENIPSSTNPRTHSITGDRYQVSPTGEHDRIGGKNVIDYTDDEGAIASARVRRLLEKSYEEPDRPLWVGFNDNIQTGYQPAPVEFDYLFQHLWIVGTTGAGKTTAIMNTLVQLAYAGYGYVYFDPKAKDSMELLRKLPAHRLDDVVWIEPGDDEYEKHVAINFLDVPDWETEAEKEKLIEDRLDVLKAIFDNDDYWGPRMQAITESMGRAMLKHNAETEDAQDYYSIIDFYFILLNAQRREDFAEKINDPYLGEFLGHIAEMDDSDIDPLLTRIKPWVENGIIRKIAACRQSSIDFQEIINDNKIVIVRTPVSNDDIKQMITLGTMRPIWTAVQNRSFKSGEDPTPFFAVMDEADKVLNDNLNIEDMLARARSMRLSVTLACQHPGQMEQSGILGDVENNCNTVLRFRVNKREHARTLMKSLRGYETEDLLETEDYRIWTRIPLKGGSRFSDPLKLHSFAPYPPLRSREEAEKAIEESLERYGTDPLTDAEIQRELHVGGLNEAITPQSIEMTDEENRDSALKTIFDESIRSGSPGGFVPLSDCMGRLERYLPIEEGSLNSEEKTWRNLIQPLQEDYLTTREGDAGIDVQVDNRTFLQVGQRENDGSYPHWKLMESAYVPLTQLGFVVDIPQQSGGSMPDAFASLDDALFIPEDASDEEQADAIADYTDRHPELNYLAGVHDAVIEAEKSTGKTKPAQTVENANKAARENRRCLVLARPDVVEKVHDTLCNDPPGFRSNHSVAGERRLYTLHPVRIDGRVMTRPGEKGEQNVWVYDESAGQYVLRDTDGNEFARFDSVEEITSTASAYPGGDVIVREPIVPDFSMDDFEIVVVPKEARTPADLSLYRHRESNLPLDRLSASDGPLATADDGGSSGSDVASDEDVVGSVDESFDRFDL